jgi:hypothetical protein
MLFRESCRTRFASCLIPVGMFLNEQLVLSVPDTSGFGSLGEGPCMPVFAGIYFLFIFEGLCSDQAAWPWALYRYA